MVNWPIFSERHGNTIIQKFRLRNLSGLLERHFYPCATPWNYIVIGGVARTVQKPPKFAILYGKTSGVQWDPARSGEFRYAYGGLNRTYRQNPKIFFLSVASIMNHTNSN